MFNYPTPTAELKMRPEHHKVVGAARTALDAQSDALDFSVLTSTANIFEKLYNIGYRNIGNGSYLEGPAFMTSGGAFAASFLVNMTDAAANRTIMSIEDAVGTHSILWMFTTQEMRFDVGAIAGDNRAVSSDFKIGRAVHVHCQYTGSAVEVYIEGVKGTDAPVPIPPVLNNQVVRIWQRYNDTLPALGDLYGAKFWDGDSLTEAEILEVKRDLRWEFGRFYV